MLTYAVHGELAGVYCCFRCRFAILWCPFWCQWRHSEQVAALSYGVRKTDLDITPAFLTAMLLCIFRHDSTFAPQSVIAMSTQAKGPSPVVWFRGWVLRMHSNGSVYVCWWVPNVHTDACTLHCCTVPRFWTQPTRVDSRSFPAGSSQNWTCKSHQVVVLDSGIASPSLIQPICLYIYRITYIITYIIIYILTLHSIKSRLLYYIFTWNAVNKCYW